MKHLFNKNRLVAILSLLLLVGSFYTCKNPLENFNITINSNISGTTVSLMVTNANPQSAEQTPPNLKLKIEGKDASKIYEISGTDNFVPQQGAIDLIVNPTVVPTSSNPIEFTVVASAPGYMDVNYAISIGDTGNYNYGITMVKLNDAPAGVSAMVSNLNLGTDGKVTTTQTLETPSSPNKSENVKLSIPAGTIMLDAEGNPVTGSVQLAMAHHDNRTIESITSFPGGLFAPDVFDKDGKPMDPVSFETLGLVNIEIGNATQKVKSFSQPIIATVELNTSSINPLTNIAIKEGDSVPIWSRDQTTGAWTLEGYQFITKDPTTNKLVVDMRVSHLSPWNIDWFWWSWWSWRPWPVCNQPRVTINSNISNRIYYELVNDWGGWVDWGYRTLRAGSNVLTFNAQQGRNARLRVYNGANWWSRGSLITQTNLFSLCGGSANINVNFPVPVTVDIQVAGNCPNNRVIKPSLSIYFKNNGWWEYLGYMQNGRLVTTKFELGKTYTFGANYNGKWYEYTRLVDKTNYNEVMQFSGSEGVCK
ncbi:MAG: hypothetical protein Q8R57_12100 [Bacteroidota bacterium]|nr:hypothetical protein [Bacteroidota bacterium]